MKFIIALACLSLFVFISCTDKTEESSSRQTPSDQPQISQGAAPDSGHGAHNDSVDAKGKPLPPVPIEEMTREQLNSYKKLLTEKGFYTCCIEPSCRMCLFEAEECPCQHNVKKKEAVCGECFDGWQAGKGSVRGVKPADVKKL